MRAGLISVCVCFAAYLLFAGTLSLSEILTGAVLSAVSAAGTVLLTRVSARHFAGSAHHVPVWSRALGSVPSATVRTGWALAGLLAGSSARAGRADTRPFRAGRTDDPEERARRATAVLAASLAPSTFVVNVPMQRDEALLHGIDSKPPATNPEWLA